MPRDAKLWEVVCWWEPWETTEALISALKLVAKWFLSVHFLQRRICSLLKDSQRCPMTSELLRTDLT